MLDQPNKSAPVRVLLVEDDEDDFVLTRDMLSDAGPNMFELEWVDSFEAGAEALKADRHDICLVDYRLGAANGFDLLRLAEDIGCTIPIVMLTGQSQDETDQQALRLGAADYLVKGEIQAPLLARSIRYAIEHGRNQKRLLDMAQIDDLTGLANRAMFMELLNRAIVREDRSNAGLALYFIDLDRFKRINDTLGHKVGDLILQETAERLRKCVRESDTVARLGGDEFTVIAERIGNTRNAALVAETILKALEPPHQFDGNEFVLTASVGIAMYPEAATEPETLIKNADMAMYRAKDKGRNDYQFHTDEITNQAVRRMTLEAKLRRAIDRDEFVLYYQPQMNLGSGEIYGVEALIRWRDAELGLIPPGEFIGLAEETGLIVPIGEWVLENACAQARRWHTGGFPNLSVAINLSARQFRDDKLTQTIARQIERTGIDPALIEVELTEGPLAQNGDSALGTLRELKEMGVRIAVDDFGTGFSSLSYLKRFPVDALKIDRSFVSELTTNPDDTVIVEVIIGLGHRLGLKVIAEGVETEEQLAFLKRAGCDAAQGFYIARPMPAGEVAGWLDAIKQGSGDRYQGSGIRKWMRDHCDP